MKFQISRDLQNWKNFVMWQGYQSVYDVFGIDFLWHKNVF
jgi:hypothetical protein